MRDNLHTEGALVESAGKAFLESDQFQKWSRDTGSRASNLLFVMENVYNLFSRSRVLTL
jgi:hypothetical protein